MEEMSRAIKAAMNNIQSGEDIEGELEYVKELRRVASSWAGMSVATFKGKLLKRSLKVSTAINDFLDEYTRT